ncbi:MAG: ROK family protein [Kiritimatiellae bacterium]|nr:ROK family protein [Kiritimatiellia bacterium]
MLVGAIDCGGTKVLAALVDEKGTVFAPQRASIPTHDKARYFGGAVSMLRDACREQGVAFETIERVGVSIPGMVDETGLVLGSPSAGWSEFPVKPILRPFLPDRGIQLFLENDVNACALAERRFASGGDDFIWLTVSTGIGGAIVSGGHLLRGATSCAGEIGHMKVEFDDPAPCGCGDCGCLEAHASGTAIGRASVAAGIGPDALACAKAAQMGDPVAQEIWQRAGGYIGRALAAAACVVNPRAIYLGGGVSSSFNLFSQGLKNAFFSAVLPQCAEVNIQPTRLGYNASLLGAAALCFRESGALRAS